MQTVYLVCYHLCKIGYENTPAHTFPFVCTEFLWKDMQETVTVASGGEGGGQKSNPDFLL